jgi:hypothetical protein
MPFDADGYGRIEYSQCPEYPGATRQAGIEPEEIAKRINWYCLALIHALLTDVAQSLDHSHCLTST